VDATDSPPTPTAVGRSTPFPAAGVRSPRVLGALLLVQVFFATLPIAVKLALRDLSAPALALLRVGLAALLLLALHRLTSGESIARRRDYLLLALYSVFGVIANQLLYITALTLTTATAVQTLVVAGPALTLLVAIVLRRERGTAAKWLGIVLAGSGALLLVGVGVREGSALGNLLALLNVTVFSIYLVISRDLLSRYRPLTVVTWVFLFGVVGMIPWGLGPALSEVGAMGARAWLAVAWIVLLPTVGAYYLNLWALERAEASLVATFVYLQPIGTAALAIPLLGERPSLRMVPAALLIFIGVWVALRAGRRSHAPVAGPHPATGPP
jgi:drug/metabolite transporter (DMT)-like permease